MPDDELAYDWMRIVAERKIKDGIDQGLFDNLPGRGKPLQLDDDSTTPPHLRTAHRIMRNAGIAPEWILLDREISSVQAQAEVIKQRALAKYADTGAVGLMALREEYRCTMKEANNLILKHNIAMPSVHRGPIPFRIKERLAEWDSVFSETKE